MEYKGGSFKEVSDKLSLMEFQEAFEMFDADGSGDIDVQELGTVFA